MGIRAAFSGMTRWKFRQTFACYVTARVESRDGGRIRREGQQAPRPRRTTATVLTRIARSVATDQLLDIVQVEADHPATIHVAPAADLPGAGDSRHDREPAVIAFGVESLELLAVPELQGAGTDQAHLPDEDVPELGKLVDAGTPEEPAQGRDPRVVLDLEEDTAFRLVPGLQVPEPLLGVRHHGPEFQAPELLTTQAHPLLPEQDRPSRIEPDQQPDDRHERRQEDQASQ